VAREDLLANLLHSLISKEDPPTQDDNTLIQKMVAPNDNVQLIDNEPVFTKSNPSNYVWGGYVGTTYYNPGWIWGAGQYK
jgi:hypothetical protein